MIRNFWSCLVIFELCFAAVFADTIYFVGLDENNFPTYWSGSPSNPPSSGQELNISPYSFGSANGIALSSTGVPYIVGQISDADVAAAYWTVSPSGGASDPNVFASSNNFSPDANNIAFNPAGAGYIVGADESQNPAYWTLSTSGVLSGPFDLPSSIFAVAVAFSSSGAGYIVGADGSDNACYWTISNTGVIGGPIDLPGGEMGGAAGTYAVAIDPSGTAYIVGSNTGGFACYWTVPPNGSPSSAFVLDGGFNSVARGVAFLPSGEGIFVGQTGGNVSSYWTIGSGGAVSLFNALPNGSGSGSSAYGVAFDSTQTAYIVGADNAFNGVYWTVPLSGEPVGYNVLGANTLPNAIAIALSPIAPTAPTTLTGQYVINDFALLYENCAVLNWSPSDSNGIVNYNIYRNGVVIGSVSGATTQYQAHNQDKSGKAVYAVTAVNTSGDESAPVTVTLN